MTVKKLIKIILIGLASFVVVTALGFVVWTRVARYEAAPEAVAAVAAGEKTQQGWYVFPSALPSDSGFIFYPGALVDPVAYAPVMKALAARGVTVVIVPMPLDLAVFGINKAAAVISAFPAVKNWALGGHSLGGAMAAQYVSDNPGAVQGVVFLASYPAGNLDLSGSPLKFASIYGTLDGLAAGEFEASRARMPAQAAMLALGGGNHAQFGDYGKQAGDGAATMSRAEQQSRTVDAIAELISSISE